MIELDKNSFINITKNKKRTLKSAIYSCYKDLFDNDYSGAYIMSLVFSETGLVISRNIIYSIKRDKKDKKQIDCLFKPAWRDTNNTHQENEKNNITLFLCC